MKRSLITLLTLALITSAFADDAAIKKQLVGNWSAPNNILIFNSNGIMPPEQNSKGVAITVSWDVRNGKFIETRSDEGACEYKLTFLSKDKMVLQSANGRENGTWTRIPGKIKR